MIDWAEISGFQWDEGNARKSEEKHAVIQSETEQVFFNQPLLVLFDEKHSQNEERYHALGNTNDARFFAYNIYSSRQGRIDSHNFRS